MFALGTGTVEVVPRQTPENFGITLASWAIRQFSKLLQAEKALA